VVTPCAAQAIESSKAIASERRVLAGNDFRVMIASFKKADTDDRERGMLAIVCRDRQAASW
jgi:hypothetical protein